MMHQKTYPIDNAHDHPIDKNISNHRSNVTDYLLSLLQSGFRANKINLLIYENKIPFMLCQPNVTLFASSLNQQEYAFWQKTLDEALETGNTFQKIIGHYSVSGMPIGRAYIIIVDGKTDYQNENIFLKNSIKQLHCEQEKFYDYFDSIDEPIWIRDKSLNVIFANKALLKNLDVVSYQDFSRDSVWICDRRKSDMLAKAALEKKEKQSLNITYIHNRTPIKGIISEEPIFVDNGDVFIFGTISNKDTEESLSRRIHYLEKAVQEILTNINVAAGLFDNSRRLRFYNQAFVKMWELSEEYLDTAPDYLDMLDKLKAMRLIPETRDSVSWHKEMLEPYKNPKAIYEDIWHTPQQKIIKCAISPYGDGGVVCLYEDITSSVALEASYKNMTTNLRNTLDSLEQVIILIDYTGKIKVANEKAHQLFGFNIQVDSHLSILMDSYDTDINLVRFVQKIYHLIQNGFDENERYEQQFEISQNIYSASASRLVSSDILIVLQDTTASINYQKTLSDKTDLLEENEHIRESFFRRISHNLRDPMTAIAGFTEMLQTEIFGTLNQKQKEYLQDMRYSIDGLLTLSENLADLVRLDTTSDNPYLENLALNNVIKQSIESVKNDAFIKNITVNFKPETDHIICADSAMLKQMFVQILENAIFASPKDKNIHITINSLSENIQVDITDEGKGLSDTIIQALHHKKMNQISGYGLRYVLRVALFHHINFNISHLSHGGTSFGVILNHKDNHKK